MALPLRRITLGDEGASRILDRTIAQVKSILADQVANQECLTGRMVFGGRILSDQSILSDLKLSDSSVLQLALKNGTMIFVTIRADGLISSATPSRKPSLSPHSSQIQVQDKIDGEDEVIAADDAEDENECCICLESLQLPIVITCKHRFCFLCLKSVTLTKGHVCPLCRSPFNPSVLTRASIGTDVYDSTQVKNSKLQYQWEYAGRTHGWWLYDEATNTMLETNYQKHLMAKAKVLALSTSAATSSSSSTFSSSSSPQSPCTATAPASPSTTRPNSPLPLPAPAPVIVRAVGVVVPAAVAAPPRLPESTCSILIGHQRYTVDFVGMYQESTGHGNKRRNIQRRLKTDIAHEFQKGHGKGRSGVKGQAGVNFTRTESVSSGSNSSSRKRQTPSGTVVAGKQVRTAKKTKLSAQDVPKEEEEDEDADEEDKEDENEDEEDEDEEEKDR